MRKGVRHTFEDGQGERIIPPLSAGSVEILEEKYGKLHTWGRGGDTEVLFEATVHALRRNYPELTPEYIKNEMLDLGNLGEVFAKVIDVNGLIRKDQDEQGEKKPGEK